MTNNNCPVRLLVLLLTALSMFHCGDDPGRDTSIDFDGSIDRAVLSRYLSLAVTHAGICDISEGSTLIFDEDRRMLTNIGAKFIGRASFLWSPYDDIEWHFSQSAIRAGKLHSADPQIILQACIFECVSSHTLNRISVPDWVFEAFSLPVATRNFSYEGMLFSDNSYVDHWGTGLSVPDITRTETRMWIYYLARRYIDAGFESLHFGQVDLTGRTDKLNNWNHWHETLTKIREYAKTHARRRLVLCDAHTAGMLRDGVLLLDFHSAPLRPYNTVSENGTLYCEMRNWSGASYDKNMGGTNINGFPVGANLALLEFDNGGIAPEPGTIDTTYGTWGYDEITWFTLQPGGYKNQFLVYADAWLRNNFLDNGQQVYFLQPATRRQTETGGRSVVIPYQPGSGYNPAYFGTIQYWPEFTVLSNAGPIRYLDSRWYYKANRQSDLCPQGHGQEATIKAMFGSR